MNAESEIRYFYFTRRVWLTTQERHNCFVIQIPMNAMIKKNRLGGNWTVRK